MTNLSDIIRISLNNSKSILFILFLLALVNCHGCGDNPVTNENPVISNLVAPNSIEMDSSGADTVFFAITVSDPQGLDNIDIVYFTIENPNNSIIPDTLFMTDDGQNGDSTASDGVYSKVIIDPGIFAFNGDYIFHFKAIDEDNNQSNAVNRTITVIALPYPYVSNLNAPDRLPLGLPEAVNIYLQVDDLQGPGDIDKVYFTIERPDGSMIPETSFMYDDGQNCDKVTGDGIYSFCLTAPDTSLPAGEYIYYFTAIDNENNQANIIEHVVDVVVGSNPYVYNLIAPDSLEKGSPDTSYLFLSVWDPQGHNNINQVYFVVIRPDSSSNNVGILMFDRGDNGDSVAGDGIYTLGILAPADTNQTGDYLFRFTAIDDDSNFANIVE